jgi:hypothetical protein
LLVVLTDRLLKIDLPYNFYCGLEEGKDQKLKHTSLLMDQDQNLHTTEMDREKNFIESLLAISNVYVKKLSWDMFAIAHNCDYDTTQSSQYELVIKHIAKSDQAKHFPTPARFTMTHQTRTNVHSIH